MTKKIKTEYISFVLMEVFLIFLFAFIFSVSVQRVQAVADNNNQLELGSIGSNVVQLQQFLAKEPSIYPEGIVSGYFGTFTQVAVMRFQKIYNISETGKVDIVTQAKIKQIMLSDHIIDASDSKVLTSQGLEANTDYYHYYLSSISEKPDKR